MSGSRGRGTYNFRIQAEGFAEFVQDLRSVAGESEAANRAIETLVRSSPQLASAMEVAAAATERAAKRAVELREQQDRGASSAGRATQTVGGLSTALGDLEGKTTAARRAAGDLRGALDLIGASTIAQRVGDVSSIISNVGDLFGTAGLAAGRFEGALSLLSGRLAAVAGIVALPLFLQSVGLGISTAGEAAQTASGAMGQWQETLLRLNPTLEQTAAAANAAADAIRKANLASLESSFGVNLDRRAAAIARLPQIDAQLVQAERSAAEAEARAVSLTVQAGADAQSPILRNRTLLGASTIDEANRAAQAAAAARERVTALRNERLQYEGEIQRLSETAAEFQNARALIQGAIYGEPAGPEAPAGLPASAAAAAAVGRRIADTSARDAAELERDFQRSEQLARRTAEAQFDAFSRVQTEITRAQQREEAVRERSAERVTDSITRYAADGFADLFQSVEGGWAATLRKLQQTAQSTVIRFGAEALIRPVVASGVNALGLGSGAGGLSDLLGLGQTFGQATSLLGLGSGGGIGSLLAQPIFGQAALTSSTNSALAALGPGVYGPAAPSALGLGGATFGQALGGIGGGFAIGSTIGGLIAGNSAARQTSAQIGAGLGAGAGFLIGGPVGGLIGGGLGGALGGVLGPGEKTNAFGYGVTAAGGQLGLSGLSTTGDGAGGDQAIAAAQQQVAQINAALAAAGLTVRDNNRAVTGGGNRPTDGSQSASFEEALRTFRFSSGNGNVQTALDRRPEATLDEALAIAQNFEAVKAAIESLTAAPVSALTAELRQIGVVFDAARASAAEYGLAQDELNRRQQEAVTLAETRSEAGLLGGLTQRSRILGGFLETRARSTGSAQSQFAAARSQFDNALAAAGAAGTESADLSGLVRSAEALLTANSAFNGGGAQAAAVEAQVRGAIIAVGGQLDLPGFTDDLTGAIYRAGERQVNELQLLRNEVTAMREELRGIRLLSARG
ncbi:MULTISPECIES: hypothetical protein [Roseomonadaceae]|uniref:Bacteriophage tail tape measure N-terminal domain-containing protein n=1 Tax=Falsiroseomonas oleicola TaxID=2801474 RepID=A0ABS6H5R5_9PROT|nr:hypothetical protein [Roseomonas oleicola]MBU8543999.1 hypothetical protein [Roseomonas oleicola]